MAELTVPTLDFTALGNLGADYKKQQADAVTQQTLAQLGKTADGKINTAPLYASGNMQLAQLGMQIDNTQHQTDREVKTDARQAAQDALNQQHWAASYELQKRAAARADEGPEETAMQRAAAARANGVDPASPEGRTYILTGKLPDATPKTIDIKRPGPLGDTITETMQNTPQGPRPIQFPGAQPQAIPQAIPQPSSPTISQQPAPTAVPQAAPQPGPQPAPQLGPQPVQPGPQASAPGPVPVVAPQPAPQPQQPPPDIWTLQGPDFLKALAAQDPKSAQIVKGIADHEIDPNKLSIVGGHRERLLAAAKQYDPEYDAALAPARFAAIKEFNSGGPNSPAATIVSGGTTIGHLLHASDTSQRLGGTNSLGPLNSVVNKGRAAYEEQSNDPTYKEYNTTIGRIAEEGTKFYRGVGGTESDISRDIATMQPGQSQESRDRALATQAALIYSKVAALQDRFKQAMGTRAWEKVAKDNNFPVISEKNRDAVNVILKRGGMQPLPGSSGSASASNAPDPLGIR